MVEGTSLPTAGPTATGWGRGGSVVVLSLIAAFAGLVAYTAWLSDDAYITLRTVDNFINGLGLTWNPGERVQAFTHPLWMLLLSAGYAVTREGYYTTIVVSLVLTLVMTWLLAARVATSLPEAVFGLAALMFSRSFVDFSTSGLENSLTHLLVVSFFAAAFRLQTGRRKVFVLSLLVALAMLNRLDSGLLLLPPLLMALVEQKTVWQTKRWAFAGAVLLGFAPLMVWELFSLVYYGYLFPNTYYAKLNTGIPAADMVRQGLSYFRISAKSDPVAFLILLGALPAAILSRRRLHLAALLGIGLYLLYILRIGGDFMVGRFFTAPMLAALVVIVSSALMTTWRRAAVPLAVLVLVGIAAPLSPVRGDRGLKCGVDDVNHAGIANERGCFFEGTGLRNQSRAAATVPVHPLAGIGLSLQEQALPVHILGTIGLTSFFAGPGATIIDVNALADPLLARIPLPEDKAWRIGHFERLLPGGYIESVVADENKLCDPNLAAYYDKLRLITQGRLVDGERLAAIWRMNTGGYEPLVRAYAAGVEGSNKLCNAQAVVTVPFSGGPNLAGYTIESDQVKAGKEVDVTLYWQGRQETPNVLASFVHVRNSQQGWPMNPANGSEMWAQDEHYAPGGRLTTDYWPSQVYADVFRMRLPADMPPGVYYLEAGWFDEAKGEQLEPDPAAVQAPLGILWRSILLPPLHVASD